MVLSPPFKFLVKTIQILFLHVWFIFRVVLICIVFFMLYCIKSLRVIYTDCVSYFFVYYFNYIYLTFYYTLFWNNFLFIQNFGFLLLYFPCCIFMLYNHAVCMLYISVVYACCMMWCIVCFVIVSYACCKKTKYKDVFHFRAVYLVLHFPHVKFLRHIFSLWNFCVIFPECGIFVLNFVCCILCYFFMLYSHVILFVLWFQRVELLCA